MLNVYDKLLHQNDDKKIVKVVKDKCHQDNKCKAELITKYTIIIP